MNIKGDPRFTASEAWNGTKPEPTHERRRARPHVNHAEVLRRALEVGRDMAVIAMALWLILVR
jgi:hypothetical protein